MVLYLVFFNLSDVEPQKDSKYANSGTETWRFYHFPHQDNVLCYF